MWALRSRFPLQLRFRLFCCIVAHRDYETDHIDAVKAFTQSDVDADIYVEMPEGFRVQGCVLKLKKALEGIRQGAHLWFKLNHGVLCKLGFVPSLVEPNLYTHPSLAIVVAVFVDDIIAGFHAEAAEDYGRIKEAYSKEIRIGSPDSITPVHVFTGVEISRDRERRTITLTQTGYISRLQQRFAGKFEQMPTPVGNSRDARASFDKLVLADAESAIDPVEYLRVLGAVMWPANMTRPDISYYTSWLGRFSTSPGQEHLAAAYNVLGYLVKTKHLGITFGGALKPIENMLGVQSEGFVRSGGLHAFHDSSWGRAAYPMGGFVVMYGNGAISWSARQLKVVADSSAEAETAVASRAAKEVVAIRIVMEDLGCELWGPTPLIGDSQPTRDLIVKPGSSARTRYFERATMLVKRLYMKGVIEPYLVPTSSMVADIFTKSLDRNVFARHRDYMLNSAQAAGALDAIMHTRLGKRLIRMIRDAS